MRRLTAVALGALAATAAGCAARGTAPATAIAAPAAVPSVLLLRAERLAAAKARLRAGDPTLRPAYDALLADARAALDAPVLSVMDKQRLAPSGDRHDYVSFGPYWWPDSTKSGGLPWVRRDGEVNPEARRDSDSPRFLQMADALETLALAYHFTDDEAYARRAALQIRRWFLDSATRMNPHLRYAQAIPGVLDGRGIGIIDTRDLARVVDAVALIERSPAWTPADRRGMTAWCRAFLGWLTTSDHGRDEQDETNNHGTWYDAQVMALALFVGDTARARAVATRDTPARLDAQVAADGRQPHELERTRPLHYSLFNLEAFERVAELGRHVGVDFWRHVSPAGGTLHGALRFVAPYADPAVRWPTPQTGEVEPGMFALVLRRGAAAYGDATLAAAADRLPGGVGRTHRARLLYPDAPARPSAGLDTLAPRALRHALAQLRRSADALDPANGYPRATLANGAWELRPARSWTSGFFAGQLWYAYELTGDDEWRRQAERWTAGLEPVKDTTSTHDLGFVIHDSFGHGWRLTGNPHYRNVVLDASRTLARRYSPVVGAIKSWDTERESDRRRDWAYPVIVDNLMNLEMLFRASAMGGDTAWRAIAERHALTSLRSHLRPDGSSAHVALFDPATGALLRQATWQGAADSSTWSRGQAWAIHGFTMAYRETGRPELLAGAERAAAWFVAHLPHDRVPYWDFSRPDGERTERDASAAAVAASGLFELAALRGGEAGARWRAAAEEILASLCARYLADPARSPAILQHATGGRPQGVEIDVGLSYADYYFMEALVRMRR